ncbi:hypothetical protein OS965_39040 [Streptomyces sp. H27-G5]|uniref:hypothetical protein n=1 Tax=Streptomyces sp. H27-G5 TaxID=2996698 RepID=UPI00226EE4FD|nr:hypothetical protein [Streptomyces sp. H27-G5]MCY0924050.1 hypothetical protein [Streptomyces sp. H27-G5]
MITLTGSEAFSAMLALAHLPPSPRAGDHFTARLAQQVEAARRRHRFSFFPHVPAFAADTDCTAVAAGALYERGLITRRQLALSVHDLLRSAVPPDTAPGSTIHPGVFTVYWDDTAEPQALPRGRKHDAVACANTLYTLHLDQPHTISADPTLQYLSAHLTTRRYLAGTRYYPSPEVFLHAASRLCACCAACAHRLAAPLHRALEERDARTPGAPWPQESSGALDLALRIISADNLRIEAGQQERRAFLVSQQRENGSWPAHAYYRMGRFPLYFGSAHLTTLFALTALHTPQGGEGQACG